MNKYVVLTFNVCNMGGGQLFVLRRALYLKKKGYDVCVFTVFDNGIFPLKQSFEGIQIYNCPELANTPSLFTKNQQESIIVNLINKIGFAEEYYFESHTLELIAWGELLSARLNGKHLAYPLSEPCFKEVYFEPTRSIIAHKMRRREFYGNNSRGLTHIFEKEPIDNLFINIAFDENELKETCRPPIGYNKQEGDYVITTVSRLDKTYIEPLIEDVKILASKYTHQHFVLIIAGGSNTGTREKDLIAKFSHSDIDNLLIIFTGYINELGKDIFNMSDIFVGMGTASINAISQGCIALNIDPSMNNKCSGIFGVDTTNFAYTENGTVFSILEKIEEIYLSNEETKGHIKTIGRRLFEDSYQMDSCFQSMNGVICSFANSKDFPYMHTSRLYRFFVLSLYKLKQLVKKVVVKK